MEQSLKGVASCHEYGREKNVGKEKDWHMCNNYLTYLESLNVQADRGGAGGLLQVGKTVGLEEAEGLKDWTPWLPRETFSLWEGDHFAMFLDLYYG